MWPINANRELLIPNFQLLQSTARPIGLAGFDVSGQPPPAIAHARTMPCKVDSLMMNPVA